MRTVVGLGNPGFEYARTRHNVGFLTVERLAARWRIALHDVRCGVRLGPGSIAGVLVCLAEPLEFMNRSGESVLRSGIDTEEMIVVHDDMDLVMGQLRLRRGGGAGGHRGVQSLLDHLGPDFIRVRVGVGRPPIGEDIPEYVLAPIAEDEWVALAAAVERAADAVEVVLRDGLVTAMNTFNVRRDGDCPIVGDRAR